MMDAIRTERRYGVTARPNPNATARLYALRVSETWDDLLDVMEQVCIEIETLLINTDADEEAAVLANHKMAKAAWNVFIHMQEKVEEALNAYLSSVATQPAGPIFTDEERERENILNPTVSLRSPLSDEDEDVYGPN